MQTISLGDSLHEMSNPVKADNLHEMSNLLKETICRKSQSPFSGKNNKNVFILSFTEFAQSVLKL